MNNTSRKLQIGIRKRGFTLIEVMAGVALFSVALFGSMLILGYALGFGTFANSRAIAMNEVRRILEDIRRLADSNGLSSMAATYGNNWSQSLSNLPSGTVSVRNTSGGPLTNNADPLPVRVSVSWQEKGKATVYQVETAVTKR